LSTTPVLNRYLGVSPISNFLTMKYIITKLYDTCILLTRSMEFGNGQFITKGEPIFVHKGSEFSLNVGDTVVITNPKFETSTVIDEDNPEKTVEFKWLVGGEVE